MRILRTANDTDALLQWRSREIFPTDFGSIDLRGLSRELRNRSVFSARVTNTDFLAEIASVVDDMLDGKIDRATGRLRLFRKLKELGYDPAKGFPDDVASIPPAERDSLRDISSVSRLNLILDTNETMVVNYGLMVQGNTPYALQAWPAWELVRLYSREVPRGSAESHSAGWGQRWEDAGESVDWEGALKDPMIALKDSPIWPALGEGAGGYTDTLDNPYPPFAFGTGWGWKAVERARCIDLGLISGDETSGAMEGQLTPGEREVNDAFDRLPPDMRSAADRYLESLSKKEAA